MAQVAVHLGSLNERGIGMPGTRQQACRRVQVEANGLGPEGGIAREVVAVGPERGAPRPLVGRGEDGLDAPGLDERLRPPRVPIGREAPDQEAHDEVLAAQPLGPEKTQQQLLPERGRVEAVPVDGGEARRVGVDAPCHVPRRPGQAVPPAELQKQLAHPGLLKQLDAEGDTPLDPAPEGARPAWRNACTRCGPAAVRAGVDGRHLAGTAHAHGPAVLIPAPDLAVPGANAAGRVGALLLARLANRPFVAGLVAEPARRPATTRTGHEIAEVRGARRADRSAADDPARFACESPLAAHARSHLGDRYDRCRSGHVRLPKAERMRSARAVR